MQTLADKKVIAWYIENGRPQKVYAGTVTEVQGTLVYLANVKNLVLGGRVKDIAINASCSQFSHFEVLD